jgi:hypothetical protein
VISLLRALSGALVLALCLPAIAAAQPPRNPFADLFGRTPQREGKEFTSVYLRSEIGAQWGQTLREDVDLPDDVPPGLAAGGSLGLNGDFVRDRFQLRGQGRYSYQEYRQTPAFGAPAMDASVGANLKLTTRLHIEGGASYARSPFYQLLWFAPTTSGVMRPLDSAAILMSQNETIGASAGITSNYTRRSSLSLIGFVRETEFSRQPDNNFSSVGGRVRWSRQMNRDLSVHVGYGREELRSGLAGQENRFTNELLDIGVDYMKGIELMRRTTFSFGTETSMTRENQGTRHFRVNGHMLLERAFNRTWLAQISARRTTEFLPGFRSPIYTDRGEASLAGYLSKRLILNLHAGGGQGQVGFSDPRKFISYTGDARLTFALNRHFGLFTQYVYYHYQSPPDPQAMLVLPRVARQAVSVGIQTWFSLIDKERVPSDPR